MSDCPDERSVRATEVDRSGIPRDRLISSRLTFALKFLFPSFVVCGWLVILVGGMLDLGRAKMTGRDLGACSLWLAMCAWACLRWLPLKRVRLTNRGLLVSNYWEEALIPFGSIARIEAGPRGQPVRVVLGAGSPAGRGFWFLPPGGQESQVVQELLGFIPPSDPSALPPDRGHPLRHG